MKLSVPLAIRSGSLVEGLISIPTRRSFTGLQADGSIGGLKVGSVLQIGNTKNLSVRGTGLWQRWSGENTATMFFGPEAVEDGSLAVLGMDTSAGISNVALISMQERIAAADRSFRMVLPRMSPVTWRYLKVM